MALAVVPGAILPHPPCVHDLVHVPLSRSRTHVAVSLPSAPTVPPRPVVPTAEPRARLLAVDALRGVAISLMALDHCGYFTRTNVITETYSDRPEHIALGARLVIGLLTNSSAPTFWFLAGLSLALYAAADRRRTSTRSRTFRFVLVRAGVLLGSDALLTSLLWNRWHPYVHVYDFALLSSLAVSLVMSFGLLLLPELAALVVAVACLMLHPVLAHWGQDALAHAPVIARAWFRFGTDVKPAVIFPILGWFPLTALGVWVGRRMGRGVLPTTGDSLWAASVCFAVYAISRLTGFGVFSPYAIGDGWRGWLIMSKGPPGLDYLGFNLGLGMLIAALAQALEPMLKRSILRVFITLGRASLFLYFAHLLVYRLIGAVDERLPLAAIPVTARYLIAYVAGMALLVPMARWYRQQKERHKGSVLQYL